jgi:hypothetical protein
MLVLIVMKEIRARTGDVLAVVPNGIRYRMARTAITVLLFVKTEGMPRIVPFTLLKIFLSLFMTR